MGFENKREWLLHLDFMVADVVSIIISMLVAYFLRHRLWDLYELTDYNRLTAVTVLLFICIVFFMEPYVDVVKRGYLCELKRVVTINTILMCTIFTYLFVIHSSEDYSRIMIISFYFINIVLMYIGHCVIKHIIRKRNKAHRYHKHMLLVTKREFVDECVSKLTENPYASRKVTGIFILDGKGNRNCVGNIPVVGEKKDIIEYCKQHVVDDVLIYNDEAVNDLMDQLSDMGIIVHLNVVQKIDESLKYTVGSINGILTVTTCMNYATTWQLAMKRLIDIVGGLVGVVFTGIIALVITPIIKMQSPGPVFFSQVRVGKNGRKFKIYKFRSMYMDAEERKKELMEQNKVTNGLMFKMDNDPRIFPFGHFIRKTSLDEFPQFLNVLKGDMSLVGTRPPTVDEWEQYELHHHRRLSVNPGLTGMWQVSGRSNITDFEQVVELDTKYISEWDLSLDLKILFRTVFVVLKREGSE